MLVRNKKDAGDKLFIGNKKGMGEKLLFFIFFLMMLIVALGLAGGVYSFFGRAYFDVRQTEADILFNKVVDCMDENDFFANEFEGNKELFFEKCRLNKKVLEKEHLVYVKRAADESEFFVGVYSFKDFCRLDAAAKKKELPLCTEEKVFADGKEYLVITASNQDVQGVLNE